MLPAWCLRLPRELAGGEQKAAPFARSPGGLGPEKGDGLATNRLGWAIFLGRALTQSDLRRGNERNHPPDVSRSRSYEESGPKVNSFISTAPSLRRHGTTRFSTARPGRLSRATMVYWTCGRSASSPTLPLSFRTTRSTLPSTLTPPSRANGSSSSISCGLKTTRPSRRCRSYSGIA